MFAPAGGGQEGKLNEDEEKKAFLAASLANMTAEEQSEYNSIVASGPRPPRQFTSPGAENSLLRGQNSPPRCQFFNVCNGWQKMRGALPPVPAQGGASVAQGRGTPPLVRTTEAPRSAATSAPPARSARRR